MKWQIVLEVQLHGAPDDIEVLLDRAMEHLVDDGIENPGVGTSLESGFTEIEFVVLAADLEEAQSEARQVIAKALEMPPGSELVGETARKALVPA